MAKPDGRIEKGQRLSTAISARAWNRAQDAADIVLGVRPGVTAGPESARANSNIVLSELANAVIAGQWVFFDPSGPSQIDVKSTTEDGLASRRTFFATPLAADAKLQHNAANRYTHQHIGMALDAGKTGDIVRIQVSGAVYCWVRLRHRHHGYARFTESPTYSTSGQGMFTANTLTAIPQSALCGPMRIVWYDDTNYVAPAANSNTVGVIVPAIVSL